MNYEYNKKEINKIKVMWSHFSPWVTSQSNSKIPNGVLPLLMNAISIIKYNYSRKYVYII